MRPEQVAEVMSDPFSQELLHSAIPARMAYNGTDNLPREIPIGFLWKDGRMVVCTSSKVGELVISRELVYPSLETEALERLPLARQ